MADSSHCEYVEGPFDPVSFVPKLNWKIIGAARIDSAYPLPLSIRIRARIAAGLGYQTVTLASHPYSYGEFTMELGQSEVWLGTADPEVATYLAEALLLQWAEAELNKAKRFYGKIIKRLKK